MTSNRHRAVAVLPGGPTLVGCAMVMAILSLFLAIDTTMAAWRPEERRGSTAQKPVAATLSVEKEATPNSRVQPGGRVKYLITLHNSGDEMAEGVIVTDVLPVALDFDEWIKDNGAVENGDTILWTGRVPAEGSVRLSFWVRIGPEPNLYGQRITNTVEFASENAGHGSADAGVGLVSAPDLSTSQKTSSSPGQQVKPGDLITYTVALTNTGGITAHAVITDVLGPYYTLHDALDFTLYPTATLVWKGSIVDQAVRLQFVARVVEEALLPVGATLLTNTAQVEDGVHDPFDIGDQAPPRVVRQSAAYLPAALKAFTKNYFVDPYEPNDTFDQAYGPLDPNQAYSAYFPDENDPDDYYWIEVTTLSRINVQLLVPDALDLDLWVYDADRNLVAGSSRIGPGLDESVRYRPEATGKYYIRIYRFSGSSKTDAYTLVVGFNALGREEGEAVVEKQAPSAP